MRFGSTLPSRLWGFFYSLIGTDKFIVWDQTRLNLIEVNYGEENLKTLQRCTSMYLDDCLGK